MTATPATDSGDSTLDSPAGVIGYAKAARVEADAAEARILLAAVAWADQHPPESIGEVATYGDSPVAIAGDGAGLVAEFCLAEFAAALGLSTEAGTHLVGEALELRDRLPRTWARVQAGHLASWRGRRIARETIGLPMAGAAFVDGQVSAFAHRIGLAQLDRLIAEAVARFDPDRARAEIERQWDGRHVTFTHDRLSFAGTTHLDAELELGDALDLDAAITREAADLAAWGSPEPLNARRATALGLIARRDLPLEPPTAETPEIAHQPRATGSARPDRRVVLYVHLAADAITGPTSSTADTDTDSAKGLELARIENTNRVITTDQVRRWCHSAEVTVRPVIDLNQRIHHQSYEIPERLAEQIRLRDSQCVFPWCHRSARRADLDHIQPYDPADPEAGPTATENLAALCRRHHRLKTFGGWTYQMVEPGTYEWTSHLGATYHRHHHPRHRARPAGLLTTPPRDPRQPPAGGAIGMPGPGRLLGHRRR